MGLKVEQAVYPALGGACSSSCSSHAGPDGPRPHGHKEILKQCCAFLSPSLEWTLWTPVAERGLDILTAQLPPPWALQGPEPPVGLQTSWQQ